MSYRITVGGWESQIVMRHIFQDVLSTYSYYHAMPVLYSTHCRNALVRRSYI